MAGWILVVDRNYPQHVDYALHGGFWDTKNHARIQPGDDLFFWVSGRGLAAYGVATSDLYPLGDRPQPWDDEGVRTYHYRVDLEPRSQQPLAHPSWTELQRIFGSNQGANTSVVPFRRAEGVTEVRAMFRLDVARAPEFELQVDHRVEDHESDLLDIPADQDERSRALRAVVERRGQPEFRRQLLRSYGHCLVTRCAVPHVLEAAHISPYKGDATNHPANGLLLRADIHTLFDLPLLTVTPDYQVRVAPPLLDSAYGKLDGTPLAFPSAESMRPDTEMLRRHNTICHWLHASLAS